MDSTSSISMTPSNVGTKKKDPAGCEICLQNPSKYMCPRCGIPYCSLICYKNVEKHLQCSESFYRDCVVENMKAEEKQNPESAKKMKEILQRVQQQYGDGNEYDDDEEEEELDSDDDEPLEKRLDGIDLNDADQVWKHLTEEERREFQSLTQNTEVAGDLIPEWIPWWNDTPEKTMVIDVSEEEGAGSQVSFLKLHKRQPDIMQPIPKMSDLTKVKPNQHVAKGLINVVTAYIWGARLFNGDLFDPEKIVEVSSCIIFLSSFLSKDGLFKNIEHAIADVPLNACQIPVLSEGGDSIQVGLNRDIWIIIKGPENVKQTPISSKVYLLSALTECYNIFSQASKILKRKHNEEEKPETEKEFSKLFSAPPPILSVDVKSVSKAKRKVLYLLAFANEYLDHMNFKIDLTLTVTA